jgi:hypothetical protein
VQDCGLRLRIFHLHLLPAFVLFRKKERKEKEEENYL